MSAPVSLLMVLALAAGETSASSSLPASSSRVDVDGIVVRAVVEAGELRVGDLFAVTVETEAGSDIEASFGEVGATFELLSEFVRVESPEAVVRHRATLAAFDTGALDLPPLAVIVRRDATEREVSLPPLGVVVGTVLPRPDAVPKGAKGVIALSSIPAALVVWLLAATVVGGAAAWWWRRARARTPPASVVEVELAYDEQALRDLRELVRSGLLRAGRVKEFHVRLAMIVRAFVGGRYLLAEHEMTSSELLASLRAAGMGSTEEAMFAKLIAVCDLVKFASVTPTSEQNDAAVRGAFELIGSARAAPRDAAA